jgi:hypothetical protein
MSREVRRAAPDLQRMERMLELCQSSKLENHEDAAVSAPFIRGDGIKRAFRRTGCRRSNSRRLSETLARYSSISRSQMNTGKRDNATN